MKTAFALFVVLLSVSLKAYTPPDSCLKLICPNTYDPNTGVGYINPDSVKVDSCLGSPTYGQNYANRYYFCKFPFYIFDSVIPVDSIKTVDSISSSYAAIKQQFQVLDSIYGPIYFIRDYENYGWPDSAYSLNGWVFFYFENYQCVDTIETDFNSSIDSLLLFNYENRGICGLLSVNTYSEQDVFITPNPARDYVEINVSTLERGPKGMSVFDALGFEQSTSVNYVDTSCCGGHVRIDVSSLSPGVYFVRVGGRMYKFVKL